MGLIELLLWLPFAALAMGVTTWLLVSRDHAEVSPATAPLPLLPALLALVWVVCSPLPGLALGTLGWQALVWGPDQLVVLDPGRDQAVVLWSAVGVGVSWWVVPGVAVLGWLALSHRRSVPAALTFAGVTWLGATAGMLAGGSIAFHDPADMGGIEVSFALTTLAAARAQAMLGLGLAGACLGVSVIAATSRAGLQGALWATLALPCLALTVGAFTTPPDVVSQLLMAVPIVACWLLALAVGAAVQTSGVLPPATDPATPLQ